MSRLCGSIEPCVIDDDMLQKAVEEQGPKDEAGRIAKAEGIDFKDVLCLRLDFRNILKIDNLWQFMNLTKLQLDNNIIEKIEGLDPLVNLVWLDLSFNNIETIEGLDSLVKLEDLSLYNNRISQIENMAAVKNLQVLSLGNNNIPSLDCLVYLRSFKELRTLSLAGNPISDHEDYKMFVAAHLPDLVYLDFRLLDENTKEIAAEKYQDSIDDLKRNEKAIQIKLEEELKKKKELDAHKVAFVEYMNSSFLFESMFAEDAEGGRLAFMPGVAEMMEAYKSNCTDICQSIFEYGINHYEKREAEIAIFNECLQEAIDENQQLGVQKIREIEEKTNELFSEVQNISDSEILASKIEQYNSDVAQLKETLLTLEIQLVDQLEDIIKEFERNISDMVGTFIEIVQGYMVQIRELENNYNEKLLEIAIHTLEKIGKGIFDEDIPDDVRMLFVDKDTIVNAVGASHDLHLLKIDNREDEMFTKINSWASNLIQKVQRNEAARNRKRVTEIVAYIEHLIDDLDDLELPEQMQ
ncbi:dynein regulatory complex subunit 3 [Microcaecilia unicolor]|uniref:Dynein regulatory complex subunit 3 n=1 Tax=Microcaecilia unicolor TaxID=1415580 RepID=A0A6P7YQL9_9AMPH|nr:dynein regulatory complex subunit 3 [Microcaecilia unicolor]XP_030067017.1 dynein regulatory complex subunit 3 [Microcaecilia unicolor]